MTITDATRQADVSSTVVSKVPRNAHGVSAAMQEMVRATIAELAASTPAVVVGPHDEHHGLIERVAGHRDRALGTTTPRPVVRHSASASRTSTSP
ncbi:hypothetical protein [Streptomyces mirabilis]|uniref:hypothetical protein n=1 Tax=Streptomyces mirabilis TaxID=68239 RepID=UPI0036467514